MPVGNNQKIRIRMYRVGFGDCFLATVPGDGPKPHHILIDCGVHAQGDIKTIGAVVDNIASETGGELDLIVATHAHQDHLSGFGAYAEKFRRMRVREVWLPWTENSADGDAAKLKKKHLALAAGLQQRFAAMPGGRYDAVRAALANLRGNEAALTLLKKDLGAKVVYREAGEHLTDAAGINGLDVSVLGPPRDQAFLARMDPPASERYLRAAAAGATDGGTVQPFPQKCVWRPSEALLSDADLKYFENLAAQSGEGLAFALTQAINNTSIVLLMRYGGKSMLFAGDAQYGNWEYWLRDEKAEEMLAGICFYKVSHHGSENATPRDALERMSDGRFVAMVSTQNTPWPSIPYTKLMTRLDAKTPGNVVRSDSLTVKGAPAGVRKSGLPAGVEQGELWYEYSIPMQKAKHARSGA